MDTIRDLLQEKRYRPLCVTHPGVTVLEATQLMNDERIGALLVMHGPRLVGIFTERDVLRRVVADSRNPETTLVAEVMTDNLICCEPDTPVDDVSVEGLVSIGDINAHRFNHTEAALHQVEDYIHRRA
jgi:signal-transduction protein with cAMP-binding, CBS, and nucleotidyltransferase domain